MSAEEIKMASRATTPQAKRFGTAARECGVEVKKEIANGTAGAGSIYYLIGKCVKSKVEGRKSAKRSRKSRKSRKGRRKSRR